MQHLLNMWVAAPDYEQDANNRRHEIGSGWKDKKLSLPDGVAVYIEYSSQLWLNAVF